MTDVYARDIAEDKQTNAFMGEGFEEALEKAKENGNELIIGKFLDNKDWEEY